jgi:hypothetical protein
MHPSDLLSPHIWCLPGGAAVTLIIWLTGGTRWCSCLRHCAASRKVAGSISVNAISWHNPWPWSRLSLQQKWIPGIFPVGKGSRFVGVTTLPPSCADCHEIWEPQPPGTLRACAGLYRDFITLQCDYHKPSATGWNPLVTLLLHRNYLISDYRQVTEIISVRACKLWMVAQQLPSHVPSEREGRSLQCLFTFRFNPRWFYVRFVTKVALEHFFFPVIFRFSPGNHYLVIALHPFISAPRRRRAVVLTKPHIFTS